MIHYFEKMKIGLIKKALELIVYLLIMFFCPSSHAIILYPEINDFPQRKFDYFKSITGRWGNNASCVVIHPQYVITTYHQGGGIGTIVSVNNINYNVIEYTRHSYYDVAIAKLGNANFSKFARLPELKNYDTGQLIYISGYGKGRGDGYYVNEILKGYYWKNSPNNIFRVGTNKLEYCGSPAIVTFKFSEKYSESSTDYECSVAEFDSGGGVFVYKNGYFFCIGLNYSVSTFGYSLFGETNSSCFAHSTLNVKNWIKEILPETELLLISDFNKDGISNITDLIILSEYWLNEDNEEFDINKDEIINLIEFEVLQNEWKKEKVTIY